MTGTILPDIARALAQRYSLERELGAGGMATVYLARDLRHDRLVAVKVLRPELASSLAATRFLREIGISARLQHPHLLTLIDSGQVADADGTPVLFYVMPYVQGESLRDRIARRPLEMTEVVRYLREIADALAYSHAQGLVHRDLKPENVLLSSGHALLVDFGVAKAIAVARADAGREDAASESPAPALTEVGISLGTPAYMAPEQATGDPGCDHRADIYAAGILAYEMLAGRTPFTGPAQSVLAAQVTMPPPPLTVARPEVDPRLAAIVHRCLEKDPDHRYQSADELRAALDAAVAPRPDGTGRRAMAIAGAAVLVVLGAAALYVARARQDRWARTELLPAIAALARAGNTDSAFVLATRADEVLHGDPAMDSIWPSVSYRARFATDPEGAVVYRAAFGDTTRWVRIGTTPTDSVRVPRSVTRYRFEKAGFQSRVVLAGGVYVAGRMFSGALYPRTVRLLPMTSPDTGMVPIEGPSPLADYLIDRFETTNRQFKEFVDAGGYSRRDFWLEPFVRDGRTVSWEEATRAFVDRTGRPGPATWEGGMPVPGEEDLPVGGVSWHEAMAYARFRGRMLPTAAHWEAAAGPSASAQIVPGSNFRSKGARRAGAFAGMSPSGAFDMAGNVREWLYNAADRPDRRLILGGGWTDQMYSFTNDQIAQSSFDRAPINGIRLARYAVDSSVTAAMRPVPRRFRDYDTERPVGETRYAALRAQYDYDPAPLDVRVESRDTTPPDWIVERVSYAAAYDGKRIPATVYLPKRARPPFQTVVFFPGSNALFQRESDLVNNEYGTFVVQSGRALIAPEYERMMTRIEPGHPVRIGTSIDYRDVVLAWGKDVRRTMDYLATRSDVDTARVAYYGISRGGYLGGIMLAIEPRFRAAILFAAGFNQDEVRPEADPLNFVSRIRAPVLMVNGRYDDVFPVESSQRPFFRLLGTPPEHKRFVLFDDGHVVGRGPLIAEGFAWLDRYLGPVKR
jgi:dienelactone hydrolase